MAQDQFMDLDSVDGESKDKTYTDCFDVLAWSWGVSNSGNAQQGGGQGAGKANCQDLSFTKYIDKGTPDLIQACCSGKHFPKACLTIRKAGGDSPLEYIKFTVEDLIITSVSLGGSGGEDRLTENVTLNFRCFTLGYKEQTAKGGVGATPECAWDCAANAKP